MRIKICFYLIASAFAVLAAASLSAEEPTRFTPLADNERFAITVHSIRESDVIWRTYMTLFAVKNNNINAITELFTWDSVRMQDVQFTSDLRKCFFLMSTPLILHTLDQYDLYIADGSLGEVKRVLTDMGSAIWRVSNDGRFVLFQGAERSSDHVIVSLYDIENDVIIREFEWKPNRQSISGSIQGWSINRFNNIFRLYAILEMGYIGAVADINPSTMELITLWDNFSLSGLSLLSMPNIVDESWLDDIQLQIRNPGVFLQKMPEN